jgi:hypothetical protein
MTDPRVTVKRVPQPANTPFFPSFIMMCDYNALATNKAVAKGKQPRAIRHLKIGAKSDAKK